MMSLKFTIPEVFEPMLYPARYKVYHGGRGSGKSWTFSELLIKATYERPLRVLCTREYQNSIDDSVYKLLLDLIHKHNLDGFYRKTRTSITGLNGSTFIFEGLHNNTNSIRSKEAVDICWVEEARVVSEESWEILIPTIRKDGSEIWVTFNAESVDDPVYKRFVLKTPPNAVVRKVTWRDNPWFPQVLKIEMERDRATDPDLFAHIWEGEPRKIAASQIFHGKWIVENFETPPDAIFYCGGDWGFANDPTAIIRCFIKDGNLYVDREAGGVGVEIDETVFLLDKVLPHKRWPMRGDSARPETISFLNRQGYNISPTEKGSGSIEDGIQFLRSFDKIIIHPRCTQIIEEMRLYSYKQDRMTGNVLPIPIDAHNHYVDALRYAIEPIMKNRRSVKIQLGAS